MLVSLVFNIRSSLQDAAWGVYFWWFVLIVLELIGSTVISQNVLSIPEQQSEQHIILLYNHLIKPSTHVTFTTKAVNQSCPLNQINATYEQNIRLKIPSPLTGWNKHTNSNMCDCSHQMHWGVSSESRFEWFKCQCTRTVRYLNVERVLRHPNFFCIPLEGACTPSVIHVSQFQKHGWKLFLNKKALTNHHKITGYLEIVHPEVLHTQK